MVTEHDGLFSLTKFQLFLVELCTGAGFSLGGGIAEETGQPVLSQMRVKCIGRLDGSGRAGNWKSSKLP